MANSDRLTGSTVDSMSESMLTRIQALKETHSTRYKNIHEANEAKTRLLLIDEVLYALGWPKEEFNPEHRVGHLGYTDYLLTVQGLPRLIVEAKRESYTFASPTSQNRKHHYSLKYLRSAFGPPLGEVITQAESYSNETKVPFAVLTNGAEWLLVQLRGIPGFNSIDDLYGVYFGNLLGDQFNTELMWQLLSRNRVAGGSLEEYFARINVKESDHVIVPATSLGEFDWRPREDNEHIREFYDLFFDEIIDSSRRRMLEYCFVTNTRLDQYDRDLQRALRDTAPDYIQEAKELSPEQSTAILNVETGDQKGRVVIITGSVGCGKSTFVTKVLVDARLDRQLKSVTIDLINELDDGLIDVPSRLWKYLERRWRQTAEHAYQYEELRSIFDLQIRQLKAGPYSKVFENDPAEYQRHEAQLLDRLAADPEEYFPACWRHYRKRGHGIVIFFDNVDRTSETLQKQVYNFAHRLATDTGATVLVTMREFTFFRGKEAGFLDVRSSDLVFHLQSPNLTQVISRRIKFIEEHIEGDYRLKQWKGRPDWDNLSVQITEHVSTIKSTFLTSSTANEILKVLDAVSWHDVRYFLQLMRQVHLTLGRSSTTWTFEQLLAVLMTPSIKGGSAPVIGNIFRSAYPAFQNYYLKMRVLLVLQFGLQAHDARRGMLYSSLVELLSLYGYQESWCRQSIEELVRERLLECLEAPAAEDYTKHYQVDRKHTYRVSPLAVVLTKELVTNNIYLSLIGNTLPFHDRESAEMYMRLLSSIYSALDKKQLEPDAIDLLAGEGLQRVVASYLVAEYYNEMAPGNLRKHVPKMTATESHLDRILSEIKVVAGSQEEQSHSTQLSEQQLNLFLGATTQTTTDFSHFRIPENIIEMRIGQSEQAPLILWSLVALRSRGVEWSTGMDITRIINTYLVDDHHRKAPNNISRALRSEQLQAQSWLKTRHLSPRKKLFGVTDEWRVAWKDVFDETAPDI